MSDSAGKKMASKKKKKSRVEEEEEKKIVSEAHSVGSEQGLERIKLVDSVNDVNDEYKKKVRT